MSNYITIGMDLGNRKHTVCALDQTGNVLWRKDVANTPEALAKADKCTECHFHAPVILIIGYDEKISAKHTIGNFDFGMMDATIAITQMMLQATDLGVGNICIGLFDPTKVHGEFPETKETTLISMLFLGYPAEGAKPAYLHDERIPLEDMVKYL